MLQSQKQALRYRRAMLSNLGMLLNVPLCVLAAYLGYFAISAGEMLLLAGGIWLGHLGFVLAIRTGWNLHFRDASLTVPQMVWACLALSVILFFAIEIRSLMMMGYLLVMSVGAFRLSLKGFYCFTLFTIGCYLASLYAIHIARPGTLDFSQEFFLFAGFVVALCGFTIMGVEYSDLRVDLQRRHSELKKAFTRIEELAVTDELTGLYNRRYLMQALNQQRALCNRSRYRFVLCFIDLDHFKKVNDQYGHPFGDKVLKKFAELVDLSLREVDIGARIGGEEFVLVLADTNLDAARQVCERMSKKWMQCAFAEAPNLTPTLSVGVTAYRHAERIEDTLERADQLLYEAKESGRNRIVVEEVERQQTLDLDSAIPAGVRRDGRGDAASVVATKEQLQNVLKAVRS